MTGWKTSERVRESGAFDSRQRVLVAEPAVEASEAGARALGITYWQADDRFTRGAVRESWTGEGGKLNLLGGATLLTFGPPQRSFDGGLALPVRDPGRTAGAPSGRLRDTRTAT